MNDGWLDKILNTGLDVARNRLLPADPKPAQTSAQGAPTSSTNWKQIGLYAAIGVGALLLLIPLFKR